jgi:hypothetical protein
MSAYTIVRLTFVPAKPFQPSQMVGKARSQEPTLESSTFQVFHSGRLRPYLQTLD